MPNVTVSLGGWLMLVTLLAYCAMCLFACWCHLAAIRQAMDEIRNMVDYHVHDGVCAFRPNQDSTGGKRC